MKLLRTLFTPFGYRLDRLEELPLMPPEAHRHCKALRGHS